MGCKNEGCQRCKKINGEGTASSSIDKDKIIKELSHITKDQAIKDFENLQKLGCDAGQNLRSRKGSLFVNFFTFKERLETVCRKGFNFWHFLEHMSDEYFKKQYIKNLIEYYKKRNPEYSMNYIWYRVFNIYEGSVSIFKPVIAMDIYCRYKPKSILDFTMGWGGRLVGACALNIPQYIGVDLNQHLKKPYEDMCEILKAHSITKVSLFFKDALTVDYSKLNYDLVLTSPPYYNIETYRGQQRRDTNKWNSEFYEPLFKMTWQHLQRGGHYCLNIPESVFNDVAVKVLGKPYDLIPLVKQKRNDKNSKTEEEYHEFIYVWRKK